VSQLAEIEMNVVFC